MGSTLEHQTLVHYILLALGQRNGIRVWKNQTGVAKQGDRVIAFGLKGSADISGILGPHGQRIELEVKTGNAIQNDSQKAFQKMILSMGGIYAVCRSVDDALRALGINESTDSP